MTPKLRVLLPLAAFLAVALPAPVRAQGMDAAMQNGQAAMNSNNFSGAAYYFEQGLSIAKSVGQQQGIGDFSMQLAFAYDSQEQYDRALPLYQQSIEVYRRIGDDPDLLLALSSIGIVYKNKTDYARALQYQDEALAIARRLGKRDSEGMIYSNYATIFSQKGDNKKCVEYNQKAYDLQFPEGNKLGAAIDMQNKGACQQALNDYANARVSLDRAMSLYQEVGDQLGQAGVLTNRAVIFTETGEYDKAIALYRQAADMYRSLNVAKDQATAIADEAMTHESKMDFPKALELGNQALSLARGVGDKFGEGKYIGNMGIVYMAMGDYARALELYKQSLSHQTAIDDKVGQAANHLNLGLTYMKLGDKAKALEGLEKGLAMSRETGSRLGEANGYENLGELYRLRGEHAKALESVNKAIAIHKELGTVARDAETTRAGILLETGDTAGLCAAATSLKDDDLLQGECALAKGLLPVAKAAFTKGLVEARAQRDADSLVSGAISLCMTLEKSGDAAGARKACEEAIAAIERQRDGLAPGERAHFLSGDAGGRNRLSAYKIRARVRADAADGFYWAENAKARAFVEALSGRGAAPGLDADAARREAALLSHIGGLEKEAVTAFEKKNSARAAELTPLIEAARKEFSDFVAQLRKDRPDYAALRYPQPLKADALALEPGEVLVEYLVTDSKTLVFVAQKGKPVSAYEAPVTRKALGELVAAFRKPFEEPLAADGKFAGKYAAAPGAKLYDLLLKRALTGLPKTSKLILVPDEVLGLLPFEALPRPAAPAAPGKPAAKAATRYAADDFDIAYSPSATALTLTRALSKDRAAASGFLVLADPVFDKSDARLAGSDASSLVAQDDRSAAIMTRMGVGGARGTAAFERLAETGALAEALKASYEGAATLLVGRDASKAKLMAEDLGRYKHLVLATHGILDGDLPYVNEPALVLTQIGNASGDDGFLRLSEAAALKLNADVVALTACKTGLGREVGGEGVTGLGRAFQHAGARTVLMSLWSVAEKSTTLMTAEFFDALKAGKTPREAMKVARAKARKSGFDHPFFWAPFVLVGS